MKEKKIYILGDKNCGKSLLIEALTGETPVPDKDKRNRIARRCTEVNVAYKIKQDGCCSCLSGIGRLRLETKREKLSLVFQECNGDEGRERTMNYLDTDVILICFDMTSHSTINSVQDYWLPEAKYYSPIEVPIIMVGLKSDIMTDETPNNKETFKRRASSIFGRRQLNRTQQLALKLYSEQDLFAYVNCSSTDERGIDTLKQSITTAATMQITRSDTQNDEYLPHNPLSEQKNIIEEEEEEVNTLTHQT